MPCVCAGAARYESAMKLRQDLPGQFFEHLTSGAFRREIQAHMMRTIDPHVV